MTRSLIAIALLAACGKSEPIEQLEALNPAIEDVEDGQAYSLSGQLTVTGSEQDYAFSLLEDGGIDPSLAFDLHSPGSFDLTRLSGEATVEVLSMAVFESRSIVVSDSSGPRYVADIGANAAEVGEIVGMEPAERGEELGTGSDSTWGTSFTTAVFHTDDGDVELQPGDVDVLKFDGALWRVVVVAAYDREARPDAALPGCPLLEDVLSYEMLRVSEVSDPEVLSRPPGMDMAEVGCH